MVSNARLDLPEPDSPVTTTRRSRGISSETCLRLWTRAPRTAIVVRAEGRPATLDAIRRVSERKERELLHLNVTFFREPSGHRGLANEAPVRQVLARRRHVADVEMALEMVLDL